MRWNNKYQLMAPQGTNAMPQQECQLVEHYADQMGEIPEGRASVKD